jgi:hypothetical protein
LGATKRYSRVPAGKAEKASKRKESFEQVMVARLQEPELLPGFWSRRDETRIKMRL